MSEFLSYMMIMILLISVLPALSRIEKRLDAIEQKPDGLGEPNGKTKMTMVVTKRTAE